MMASSPLAAAATRVREERQPSPPYYRVEKKRRSKEESKEGTSSSGLAATVCVFNLIETTTAALVVKKKPFVIGSVVRHREALRRARVLTAKDPTTLEIESGVYYEDFEADSRLATLECRQETRTFEARLACEGEGAPSATRKQEEEEWWRWSPDARALAEAAAATAAQPGGIGVGPRLTLEGVFLNFRDLILAGKNIAAIDQAFVHFTNLRRLDLGRNNLTTLGNLPTGLISLSCAANELSGRALDNVADLPLLASLDLSYNLLDVGSFLPEAQCETTLGETVRGSEDVVFHPLAGRDGLIFEKFAALEHLDLSWNVLCDLGGILNTLSLLRPTLRHLFLSGNPLSILPSYRARVLSGCGPLLGVLDDLRVTPEERSTAESEVRYKDELRYSRGQTRGSIASGKTMGYGGVVVACSEWGAGGLTILDMVHFKVKILRLSNLPCIDTVEVNRSDADGEGGDATAVPGGRDGVGAAADGEETKEDQLLRQWGELELRIPGEDGNLESAPFRWASEFIPSGNKESFADAAKHDNAAGDGVVACDSNEHMGGVFEEEVWEFGVAVPPSKALRDGVHFRGLEMFLYSVDEQAVDDGEEQHEDMACATVYTESTPEISRQQGKAAAPRTPNMTTQAKGEGQSCGVGHNGAITEDSGRPPEPRQRRRRLVGKCSLSLSSLLNAQWMREQALRQINHRGKDDDFATDDAENQGKSCMATEIPAKATGAADGRGGTGDTEDVPCSSVDGTGKDGACAVVSETCELVLESWVANLKASVATGDDLKNDAEVAAERDNNEPVDADESKSPLAATVTVEVTLNSHESIRERSQHCPP